MSYMKLFIRQMLFSLFSNSKKTICFHSNNAVPSCVAVSVNMEGSCIKQTYLNLEPFHDCLYFRQTSKVPILKSHQKCLVIDCIYHLYRSSQTFVIACLSISKIKVTIGQLRMNLTVLSLSCSMLLHKIVQIISMVNCN